MTDETLAQAALFRLTGVGVMQTDMTTGRFVWANRAFCEMVGYGEAELKAMTYLELTHQGDRARDEASFAALQQGERKGGTSLTRVLHKDGRVVWLELHVTLLGGGDEVVNLTVVNDVTERRLAEEALRESKEKFSTFVNATADVIYEMSADWREMRSLRGKAFVATTENPRGDWIDGYIPEDERPRVRAPSTGPSRRAASLNSSTASCGLAAARAGRSRAPSRC